MRLEARLDVLPAAQREIWPQLAAAPRLGFVLYGGTAVALHRGHRQSEDFDFFRHSTLKFEELNILPFMRRAAVLQEEPNTFVVLAKMPGGPVKVSFFGNIRFGRVRRPIRTSDGTLLVASLDDLLVTKLKAILGRAEAEDYADIAELLRAGVSLPRALSAFRQMFGGEPATVFRAIGYFEDGDVPSLSEGEGASTRGAGFCQEAPASSSDRRFARLSSKPLRSPPPAALPRHGAPSRCSARRRSIFRKARLSAARARSG